MSTSSLYFFLVAEASACSSAPMTTFLSTFFSRPRASTSNRISRLIVFSRPLYIGHQAGGFHVGELQRHHFPLHLQLHPARAGFPDHAREVALPVERNAHSHPRLVP